MLKRLLVCGCVLSALSGCGHMAPPDDLTAGRLPVVEIGTTEPDDPEYVLHIPAGKKFPVQLLVHGSLLNQEIDHKENVSIKRDIYLYREWTSYNGKNWMGPKETNEQIEFKVNVKLAGPGGLVDVTANEK